MATKTTIIPKLRKSVIDENNMDLELVDINSIKQWKNNTNHHTQKDIERLAEGIKLYGQWRPAVVWRKNKEIRVGNGMHLAMRDVLKYNKIWVVWKDFINEAEADLAGSFDNTANKWSEMDEDALRDLFTRDDVIDFTGKSRERLQQFSGFTEEEIRGIFLEPDLKKIEDIDAANTGLQDKIVIKCKPEDCKEIKDTLKIWLKDSGYEGAEIK